MKTLFRFILMLTFGAFAAAIGAGIENHRELKHAGDPVSIVGIGACKTWMGVIIISRDGVIHPEPEITPELAQQMAKTLPAANAGLVNIPCGTGDLQT